MLCVEVSEMSSGHEEHIGKVCPKTGRRTDAAAKRWWLPWVLPFAGLISLVWFLIRVIPKPSRAAYPCQRLAFPLASGFIVWLTGLAGSTLAWRRARCLFARSRYVTAAALLALAVAALWMPLAVTREQPAGAAFTPSDPPNAPVGVGKGIHPGRVVWVHDPESANWDGTTGSWWEEQNTSQAVVDSMVSQSLRTLTGEKDDAMAWDALFRYFNRVRDLGDVGYQPGEKVVIKINMNQDSGGTWPSNAGMPSPQMIHSVLEQLIHVVGVPGSAITLYDASRYIGNPIYDKVRGNPDPDFQAVRFVCGSTRSGRVAATHDLANPVHFAGAGVPGGGRAYPPRVVTEARYLINMALLRAHSLFGVTFCGKNHFGSIYWPSNGGWTPQPLHNFGDRNQSMGSYNCLVDLAGHAQLGGKTLLYMVDGLYAARNQSVEVIRFQSFGDDWTSSLFVSQDFIAIDSVALDFIRNEPRATDCTGRGVDNYLHEGALANNPPSGIFYDPEGDGTRLESLGVHEHWNNPVDKKYSRNLGKAEGIELVTPALTTEDGPVQNVTKGTRYDYLRHAVQDADAGDVLVAAPGVYRETVDFSGKALTLRSEDPNDPNVVVTTVIDGGSQAVTFAAGEEPDSVLAGFTLTGATHGIYCQGSSPTILNCRLVDNSEAGIKLWESANPTLANCIIVGNGGDGIEMWASTAGRTVRHNFATVAHCTIVGNRGSGIRGGKPIVVNSIIRANGPDGEAPQIEADDPTAQYCNVEGGFAGAGNIDTDPAFVTPGYWANAASPTQGVTPGEAVWIGGDYHLSEGSPCIDAGDPAFTMDLVRTDIDGQPRIVGPRPDIGCDEFVAAPQVAPVCVTWLGHASVRVAWEDVVVYVDPYRLTASPQDATLILVSHSHSDHYSPGDIARVRTPQTQFIGPADVVQTYGSGQALAPSQTIDAGDVRVTGVAMYNVTKTNHPRSRNWVGFIVEVGSKRLYFAGDTDLTDEMKALTGIDLAFLPAGGTYTMDAVEAAEATKYVRPHLAIPYHWGTSVGTRADAERFAALAACNVKVMTAGETLCSGEWSKDFSVLAHWKLDEAQGTTAADSAGGYDGTLLGDPIWQPAGGQVGGALQFDGVDDTIITPFVLNPSAGSFSLFAWVKGGGPGQAILSQSTGVSWLMADGPAGTLATQLKPSGRNSRDLVSAAPITDGEWHRVGLTWDGSARTLYVDGVQVAQDTQSSLPGLTTGLRFGSGPNAEPGAFWSGLLDDVRLHTRAIEP